MGEHYEPVNGDYVRVVIEGKAHNVAPLANDFSVGLNRFHVGREHIVSIEKIEPPAKVFGPGETVRHRRHAHLVYSIGEDGYYAHHAREWRGGAYPGFSSGDYEPVRL